MFLIDWIYKHSASTKPEYRRNGSSQLCVAERLCAF